MACSEGRHPSALASITALHQTISLHHQHVQEAGATEYEDIRFSGTQNKLGRVLGYFASGVVEIWVEMVDSLLWAVKWGLTLEKGVGQLDW